MKLKGAQIFFECLKKEGVEVIFGFPGGAVLDIYHEMPKHNIRHILVRHSRAPRTWPTDMPGHPVEWGSVL